MEELALVTGGTAVVAAGWLRYEYRRWQSRVERERFLLSMKAASTPERLRDEERLRLRLVREPWWAFWRWFPERHTHGDSHLAH